jgi:hypothetical protein
VFYGRNAVYFCTVNSFLNTKEYCFWLVFLGNLLGSIFGLDNYMSKQYYLWSAHEASFDTCQFEIRYAMAGVASVRSIMVLVCLPIKVGSLPLLTISMLVEIRNSTS